jgi:hypothetical protein
MSPGKRATGPLDESMRVPPANYRAESRVVAAIVGIIVAGTLLSAWLRGDDSAAEPLLDWQISAFYDLVEADQAVYNALLAASEELWYAHADLLYFGDDEQKAKPWPSVAELDELYLMPPFTRDVAWQQQGRIEWELIASFSFEGSAVYFGSGGEIDGQSAYLLALSHVHKGASYTDGATIWVHDDANVAAPETVKRDSLIVHGWKEVVPYSGAMEIERLRA